MATLPTEQSAQTVSPNSSRASTEPRLDSTSTPRNSSQTPRRNAIRLGRVRPEDVAPPRKAPSSDRSLTHSPYFCGALYERMSEDLSLGGLAERTHEGYLRAVRALADFCQQSPDQITENQLRKFFLHLKNDKKFASGSLRVAYSGLKFFYTRTCKRNWQTLTQMRIRDSKTLPEVLTRDQVFQIIRACTTKRMAVYFWTVYSLGLRMQEALNLQVGDIDAERGMIHIHRGKGAKDRYIPLPLSTLEQLRELWKTHRHPTFLFPAEGRGYQGDLRTQGRSAAKTPMSPSAVQGAIKLIAKKLNFSKKVSTHTLRHCYATHLLEATMSPRIIQQYLGHSSLQTTMAYLHLTDTAVVDARQVINDLFRWPQ